MKFRRRPLAVEAERYDGSTTHHLMCEGVCRWDRWDCVGGPHVHTSQGQVVEVREGDWVVREPGGAGYYPVPAEAFEALYEEVPPAEEGEG